MTLSLPLFGDDVWLNPLDVKDVEVKHMLETPFAASAATRWKNMMFIPATVARSCTKKIITATAAALNSKE